MDRAEEAVAIHKQGYNCAQAVFGATAEAVGLDRETALKIASGFGGGIGRRGETCGALSGAIMTLGLARCNGTPEDKPRMYAEAAALMDAFAATCGAVKCRDLLGYDISTDEGLKAAKESGVMAGCNDIISKAVKLLDDILE